MEARIVLKPRVEFGPKLDLKKIRREYLKGGLKYDDLARDPIVQFERWMKQSMDARIHDPSAMTLATVDESGQPSQRIVLLKHVDQEGFVFYTNYESRKAKEIEENSKVSLHFPWHMLERQVKVCGYAERVDSTESLNYFLSRPLESRLAAWASPQSQSVSSRAMLMQQFNAMKDKS
jgi:pyridoxamine 5'-phosphate oxidase